MEDPNFAYGLLMELTRAFLAYADNVRAQDSAAYAIQVRQVVKSNFFSSQMISYHTELKITQYKCTFWSTCLSISNLNICSFKQQGKMLFRILISYFLNISVLTYFI